MLLRCLVLLFCLTAICAQKGGRASEDPDPVHQSPSRQLAGRKIPQASEIVQQKEEDPPEEDREDDREVVAAPPPSRPSPPPPARIPPPPPARIPLPRPSESDPSGHPAPEPYSFSYKTDDPETGAATSREETQDANGEIVGFYHILDAEGRTRRVDYTAGKDGFKASIKSNEEGLTARAPADVSIDLSPSPPQRLAYAPNNRPLASETSLKAYGRPLSGNYLQSVIPVSAQNYQVPVYAPLPSAPALALSQYVSAPLPAPAPIQYVQASIPAPARIAPAPAYKYASLPSASETIPAVPTAIAPAPAPAPPTQETQRVEHIVQQKAEDPAEEAQISQTFETSEPSDPQEIVQQRNVDIEEAFESAPPTPQPPVKGGPVAAQPAPIWSPPPQRPTGHFTPSVTYSFREQGAYSLQPLAQVREISNTIQDPQPPASTKTIPSTPVAAPLNYQAYRPIAPVLSAPSIQVSRPAPYVQPKLIQFEQRGQAFSTVQHTVPNLAPISPLTNNYVFQHREHRTPISQERLLNYFQPIPNYQTQVQSHEVTIEPQAARPLQLSYPLPPQFVEITQQKETTPTFTPAIAPKYNKPVNSGYSLTVQHRENGLTQPPRQIFAQQPFVVEQPKAQSIQTEYRIQQLSPLPAPRPLPLVNTQYNTYQYRPLPPLSSLPPLPQLLAVPQQPQKQEQSFEPQTYEPLQQTYEPLQEESLQQKAEDPAEESRVPPPCKCDTEPVAQSVPQPVKGVTAPTEPQPVKSGRLSPARAFIPQAFRSS